MFLNDDLDGLSFRKLAQKYTLSSMKTWRIYKEELKKLPTTIFVGDQRDGSNQLKS